MADPKPRSVYYFLYRENGEGGNSYVNQQQEVGSPGLQGGKPNGSREG